MNDVSFFKTCREGAERFLKSFHFKCRRIISSAEEEYAQGKEIYYYYYRELREDSDWENGTQSALSEHESLLDEISKFIRFLAKHHDISLIYGNNSELAKNHDSFSELEKLVSDQKVWTLDEYDDLHDACYYDPSVSPRLIVLDFLSSDSGFIKDCAHLMNRGWGDSTSIVYISFFRDVSFPILGIKDLGSDPFNMVDGIENQIESCLNIIKRSSEFKSLSHEIVNEKAYFGESFQLPFFVPIPHLYFKHLEQPSPNQIAHLFDDQSVEFNFNYESTLISFLKKLKDDYPTIHLFIVDSFGDPEQELSNDSRFKGIIREFKDTSGYTVDSSYFLSSEYGASIYYDDNNALFVVLNVLSTSSSLHSQAIPLVNWLNIDDSHDAPVPAEVFKCLIISLFKDNGPLSASHSNKKTTFARLQNCVEEWTKEAGLPHKYFYDYYPTRFITIPEYDNEKRKLIWSFKNNGLSANKSYKESFEHVYSLLKETLCVTFGGLLNEITFFCLPTSTKKSYSDRFENLSTRLCHELGMISAFDHVNYVQDGEPKHLGGRAEPIVELDASFFSGRIVLMFDDIYTRGRTSAYRKKQLQELGAQVIGLITIGKTILRNE